MTTQSIFKTALQGLLLQACAVCAFAQFPTPVASTRPQLKGEFPLYQSDIPGNTGGAAPEQWDTMDGYLMARNVNVPTIIPVLPDPAKATGAAVLVAPGGAFLALAMDTEGLLVARSLADHGIAAFVLKYRLNPTPSNIPGFMETMGKRMAGVGTNKGAPPITNPLAIDDAAAALKLIRARAAEWKIDPNRTGMVGFSAGAVTTMTLTLEDRPGARPSFIGIIYGPMLAVTVPHDAPPMFAALASDDPLFGQQGFGLIESWHNAGKSVELHFYEHGSHGFGMRPLGTTSDLWFDEFYNWMKDGKLLQRGTP